MSTWVLNEDNYYQAVYGGWLGKNIGGTLGAPVEGVKERLTLGFYPELPDGPLENDDLDLQLVWLHALEQYGPLLTARELGQEWLEHIFFPFDEYGYALTNLRRGLIPPLSGSFNNPFADCMGSPIRSEIWAMVAPGAPRVAARLAYEDAIVDHAGGEGVYGEMFFAAIQSAVFVEKDRDRLLDIGLSYLPETSRTYRAVCDLRQWHTDGVSWTDAREMILARHGRSNFTDAPQNIAFTVLGWLYGESFEDAILKAVNCGYDTDCTAATLAAILGMIAGPKGLPSKWVDPVGDRVVVSSPIKGFPAPANLEELTRRTMRVGKQVLAAYDTGIIVHPRLPTSLRGTPAEADEAMSAIALRNASLDCRYLPAGTRRAEALEARIDYGVDGPAIAVGETKRIAVAFVNHSRERWDASVRLAGLGEGEAQDLTLDPGASRTLHFDVCAEGPVQPRYALTLRIERRHDQATWTVLEETLALVPASCWKIWREGERTRQQARFAGNRLDWASLSEDTESEGRWMALTALHVPKETTFKLVAASSAAVSAWIDGEQVIASPAPGFCMPAYHRAPDDQCATVTLSAGRHELQIAASSEDGNPGVYVLPVATRETSQPGSQYYCTDLLMDIE